MSSHLFLVFGSNLAFDPKNKNQMHFSAKSIGIQFLGSRLKRYSDFMTSYNKGQSFYFYGLIRWYLHKGTDFSKLSDVQIAEIESLINNSSRKCLGFKTPIEVASSFVALKD